nr:hypothetical protein MACL_00001338 [Theileria orientalis]
MKKNKLMYHADSYTHQPRIRKPRNLLENQVCVKLNRMLTLSIIPTKILNRATAVNVIAKKK